MSEVFRVFTNYYRGSFVSCYSSATAVALLHPLTLFWHGSCVFGLSVTKMWFHDHVFSVFVVMLLYSTSTCYKTVRNLQLTNRTVRVWHSTKWTRKPSASACCSWQGRIVRDGLATFPIGSPAGDTAFYSDDERESRTEGSIHLPSSKI